MSNFQSGTLTAVYHNIGKRTADGSVKLVRANFDILDWASTPGGLVERYALPLGFEKFTNEDLNDIPIAGNDAVEAIDVGIEFGSYQPEYIILNGGETTESWLGLHEFGLL